MAEIRTATKATARTKGRIKAYTRDARGVVFAAVEFDEGHVNIYPLDVADSKAEPLAGAEVELILKRCRESNVTAWHYGWVASVCQVQR